MTKILRGRAHIYVACVGTVHGRCFRLAALNCPFQKPYPEIDLGLYPVQISCSCEQIPCSFAKIPCSGKVGGIVIVAKVGQY
jgi:hypothetical protein